MMIPTSAINICSDTALTLSFHAIMTPTKIPRHIGSPMQLIARLHLQ